MKKTLFAILLTLLLTLPISAQDQEYWNLKGSLQGTMVTIPDDNNTAFGGGATISIGPPSGSYEFSFEAAKWWRSYSEYDTLIDHSTGDTLMNHSADSDADRDQDGLYFTFMGKARVMSLFSNGEFVRFGDSGLLDIYLGAGGGLYFLSEKRVEARQDQETGDWYTEKVDKYLETKGHTAFVQVFSLNIIEHFDIQLENRFEYIFDWDDIWDDPYYYSLGFGLKYSF